jgi:hypothetical protein
MVAREGNIKLYNDDCLRNLFGLWKKNIILLMMNTIKLKRNISDSTMDVFVTTHTDSVFDSGHTSDSDDDMPLPAVINTKHFFMNF